MKVYADFEIRNELWYKIGGKVRYLIDVESKEDIKKAFELLKKEKIKKFFFLGLGSNLIFKDEYFAGAVIRFLPSSNPIRLIRPHIIEADAGVVLDDVINFAFDHNLVGLEWAGGLPGQVGAAIRGNVGAFGSEIKDSVKEAEVFEIINNKPRFKVLRRFELQFSYRNSIVKKKKLGVINAQFRLTSADQGVVNRARQTYLNNIEYRKIRHPLEYPNCGSIFKNISDPAHIQKILEVYPDLEEKIIREWHGKVAMGYLIKRLDLSGYRVGDALVSPKHCNFIVNLGSAKASDVLSIIKLIQNKFAETFDFVPEVEVEIIQ
ncbi:MAG: UDP-N-acetylenolpyruvoylglucosamine reductase [Candidatus Levybacteria bacterium RIFCSPHIGHO2_02_FULL_40_18]|nr:MAG: UDP-N-acetylenolpyruvoylglucosamine reductase [Candidatus Levybacteria bacterium RIFCSPHIGHO2_01_FULL_40_58]OGH26379.1 MAG: UDP-N-acetylenolpyruvoylglucosamine reductase [Candidatus Levybacteria bacterium RIFCSPHIGHO2_02_FULL_40_18]OGH31826.1 MAG: UDP-N-acetylenolpyruvoylglucosamine reductase [Candidatus Levybacteria bacterium RIFCSPHIGHO2_12_FULL_40_31]OGH40459.1 MAG: UDP-N-acetylenolpyruvoylglucosamine reductase [Candidatus Levybacteria bacterium RIFCSPLOWO2_01_FULL_40_64]OGH49166.1 M